MSPLRKYQLLLFGTVAFFLYVCITEVADRYSDLWGAYCGFQAKNASLRNPQALETERIELLERQKKLKELLRAQSGSFEQSPTGVLEFVNASATKTVVKVESLVPVRAGTSGREGEMRFKLSCVAPYHRVGQFLNQIENGLFPLRVSRLELGREGAPAPEVKATMEGAVRLSP